MWVGFSRTIKKIWWPCFWPRGASEVRSSGIVELSMRRHIPARSLAHRPPPLAESHRARRGHTAALKSDSVKSSKLSDLRKLILRNLGVRYFHENLTPCQSTFRQSKIVPSVWNWSTAEICWRIAFIKQVIRRSFADLRHPEFSFTILVNNNPH